MRKLLIAVGVLSYCLVLKSVPAQAVPCSKIPPWLKIKEVVFKTSSQEVITVKFPNLVKLPCEMEGDWGPNFHFKLSHTQEVSVHFKNTGRVIAFVQSIEASAVMKAADRAETPNFFPLFDTVKGIRYDIYMHKSKGPSHVLTYTSPGVEDYTQAVYRSPIVSFSRYD